MNGDWKEFGFWGFIGSLLRILVDYRNKSLLQFFIGAVIGIVLAVIVGNLVLGLGLNQNLAIVASALSALAGDNLALGVLEISKTFKDHPLTTIFDFWKKKEKDS